MFIVSSRRPFLAGHRIRCPLLLLACLALALATAMHAASSTLYTGTPFMSAWDSKDYGVPSSNYSVIQHPQTGLMYVGSGYGVLEFDGASWRAIPLADESGVPVVVVDRQGTIWLGSTNGVSLLRPDAKGELQTVDVTSRLPEADRVFGRLYLGASGPNGVYLASPTHLVFFGQDGTARVWRAGTVNFNGLCWYEGALLVSRGEGGLARLIEGKLVDLAPPPRNPDPTVINTLRLFAAREIPGEKETLLLTGVGPLRWSGPGQTLVPLSAVSSAPFENDTALAATFLSDGRLAFSLRRQGLLILEADGRISALIDARRGLPRTQFDSLATDNQGGLWLAGSGGLVRFQFESPFAIQASIDFARAFLRRGNRLYIANENGVVWRDDSTGELHPVTGFPTAPSSLVEADGRIYGTGQYLREITDDDRAVVALPVQLNSLAAVPGAPGTFVAGAVRGLRVLHFDGAKWRDGGLIEGVSASVAGVLADKEGYVWGSGYAGAISWRVDFRGGPSLAAPVTPLDTALSLPTLRGTDGRWFSSLGGEVVTPRGARVMRYDRSAGRFRPEDRIENIPLVQRLLIAGEEGGEQWWFSQLPLPQIGRLVRNGENRWRAEPLSALPLDGLTAAALYYDAPARTLWIGNRSGSPITMDTDWRPTRPPPPVRVSVRQLANRNGEVLLGGAGDRGARGPLRLAPEQNSVRVAFAAPLFVPDYRGTLRTVYRTRLEGVEENWSAWSPVPWREFTELPYRDFVLHVQARDLEGRESPVETLAFSIAPPWWLARAAFAGYGALVVLAIGGFVRLRARTLVRRNAQLETLVAVRTAELERLRRLEMDEKISARLAEEKARLEVLRYQLNPHFLFNTLNSIYTLVWSQSRPAGNLVRRLAEFCRMTLTRRSADTATLAEEIAMIRAYLELEQIRWEDGLKVEISVAPELLEVPLPPFLLLPLVENAIKYGGHTSPELLQVRVSVYADPDGAVVIEIANTGTWVQPGSVPQIASTGIGLENLRQRLDRFYPESHVFTTSAADGWVCTRLRLSRVPAILSQAR